VLVSTPAHAPLPRAPVAERRKAASNGARPVFDGRAGATVDVPLYDRAEMPPGTAVSGPAIIAEDETSTFVSATFDAAIDAAGCIVMERKVGS
jgi:N-methylhydantoinase A